LKVKTLLILKLLISDIKQEYGGLSFFIFVKSFLNPSIHACLLVRLAANSRGVIHVTMRNILVAKHSIDVSQSVIIDEGLKLPHPFCIVIDIGVVIGDRVTLYPRSQAA
jgi:serine acetyltransferase